MVKMDGMELKEEVARVASSLGLRPRNAPAHTTAVQNVPEKSNGTTAVSQQETRIKRSKQRKQERVKGGGERSGENKRVKKAPKRKAGTKTDAYDKKALLQILSGPDDTSNAKLKELRKARSIVPRTTSPLWHVALQELPPLSDEDGVQRMALSEAQVKQRREEAEVMCQNERDAFEYRMRSSKKQGKWLIQVREQGTHVDKIAAFSLLIRDSVVSNVHEMDYLLSLAEKQKGSRDLVVHALKALTELFRCYLLPDRKLRFFEDFPLHLLEGQEKGGKLHLLFWFLEDSIKRKYARLLSALESATLAPLEHLRSESVTLVSDLIYDKPEQEAQLLSILINKMGDKSKKLGSKVAFLVSKLITKHPRMKWVVLKEAEKFVYLTGTTIRSVQCVLQTFNSIQYENTNIDTETATCYIDMCFTLFQQIVDGRIGSVVDLKRKAESKSLVSSSGKRKHQKKQLTKKANASRNVNEIDATVFSSIVSGIRRSLPFADGSKLGNLLEKHTNALFRMVHVAPFGVSVQVLALLYQILPTKTNCLDRLYRAMYEKILDPQLAESRRLPLFISTLFKAIKDDPNLARATAFVKRLLQVAANAESHMFCAFLLVVSESMKFKPGLKSGIIQSEESGLLPGRSEQTGLNSKQTTAVDAKQNSGLYRMDHREPVYCGADQTCLWELCAALYHYHPAVHSMGSSILDKQIVASRGDPLQELTLFAFLEKFVNGKESRTKSAFVEMTPRTPGTSMHGEYRTAGTFASLAAKDVPVEDVFFHKYYNIQSVKKAREARKTVKSTKKDRKDRKNDLDTMPEDESFLKDSDDDLNSLESLEMDGVNLEAEDIDEMFKNPMKRTKRPTELFDYSELMQDVEEAYQSDPEDLSESKVAGKSHDSSWDGCSGDGEDQEVEKQMDAEDTSDLDDVDGLPTEEFPDLSSDSSDMDSDEMRMKKRGRTQSVTNNDFAPAEDFFSAILDSD